MPLGRRCRFLLALSCHGSNLHDTQAVARMTQIATIPDRGSPVPGHRAVMTLRQGEERLKLLYAVLAFSVANSNNTCVH